ncbi:hypothetical protein BDV06DRAFT_205545 [Aspergillus oleicola]
MAQLSAVLCWNRLQQLNRGNQYHRRWSGMAECRDSCIRCECPRWSSCVRKLQGSSKIFIPSLYVGTRDNEHYWSHGGWNIQAYIAYITAVGLCFVGLISKIDVKVPAVGEDFGNLG